MVAALRVVFFVAVASRFRVTFSLAAEAAVQRAWGNGECDGNHITVVVVVAIFLGHAFEEHVASLEL